MQTNFIFPLLRIGGTTILFILIFLIPRHALAQQYRSYDEIRVELQSIESNYPNIADFQDIGNSWENRDILAIKISGGTSQNKPEILPTPPCGWGEESRKSIYFPKG